MPAAQKKYTARSAQSISIASPIAWLLQARGRPGDLFDGGLASLLPPTGLAGVARAAEVIADAIVQKKRIAIVGDYDCDGATASSVLLLGLRACQADVISVVPSRVAHGYGLSPAVVSHVAASDARLIVTVDNGIVAYAGLEAAAAIGIDVVVTDHHLPGDEPPLALAVVNPNQTGCPFESKAAAGCLVAWYTLVEIHREIAARGHPSELDLRTLLPLVTVGTIADVVPVDRNNALIVNYGLRRIRKGEGGFGIAALAVASGISMEAMSSSEIAFKIAPKINAAGRIADMSLGIHCLTANSRVEAEHAAIALASTNEARKQVQAEGLQALEPLIALRSRDPVIVIGASNVHEGVIGVIAGKIKEAYARPAIVFSLRNDGTAKGSMRSVPGLHARDLLVASEAQSPGSLLAFGGHAMAAGVTIKASQLDEFRERLNVAARRALNGVDDFTLVEHHDGALPDELLTPEFARQIELAPWGMGVEAPRFANQFSVIASRELNGGHAALKLRTERGMQLDAIWFSPTATLCAGHLKTLVFAPRINRWMQRERLQLMVIDAID